VGAEGVQAVKRNEGVAAGILRALGAAHGAEVSGEALCGALGVSRAAVWKHIEALRSQGYAIEAQPRRGYRLASTPNTPLATEIAPLLTTRQLGRQLHFLVRTDSTSRQLGLLAEQGAPEGAVVVADEQTDGRGRMARTWFSPPGVNLYFSLLLRPRVPPAASTTLPLLAGWGVVQALAGLAPGLSPQIKWPNDIHVGGRKICGILCDMQAEADCVRHVVVGVGVNVNLAAADLPAEIARTATSLRIAGGHMVSRPALLASILNTLEPAYLRWCSEGLAPFLDDLRAHDVLAGRRVTLDQIGRRMVGRARGIAPDGSLQLELADGRIVPVVSGDVHVAGIHD
jgi:BirA family biotin operon repressor/biotin-[acetyl-CoA-carboxylase] ligase